MVEVVRNRVPGAGFNLWLKETTARLVMPDVFSKTTPDLRRVARGHLLALSKIGDKDSLGQITISNTNHGNHQSSIYY